MLPFRRPRSRTAPGDELVVRLLSDHSESYLALARRHSLCLDDAQDAVQRATEVLLRRAPTLEPATAASWMRTVVKHEAMAVREARQSAVSREEPELDAHEACALPSAEEHVAARERLAAAAEAFARLKPQEVRALRLLAEGLSYAEIGAVTGWTHTKVNRCLTEGRRAFRARVEGIESGAECERWSSVLSAVADGEATPAELIAVRPHLRSCSACQATVRAYHATPARVAALLPVAALAAPVVATVRRGPGPAMSSVLHRLHEALAGAAPGRLQIVLDLASGGKAAAIAASTVALAGGTLVAGQDVERAVLGAPATRPLARVVRPGHPAVATALPPRIAVLRSVAPPPAARAQPRAAAPSAAGIRAAFALRTRRATGVRAAHALRGEGEFGPAGSAAPAASPAPVEARRASSAAAPAALSAPAPPVAAPAPPVAASTPRAAASTGGTSEFGP